MHSIYDPQGEDWSSMLAGQVGGGGGGTHFEGYPFQRGGGLGDILRGVFRYLLPLGKSAGAALGHEGLQTANRVLSGVLGGESLGEAAKRETKTAVRNLMRKGADSMDGKGRRKRMARGGPRDIFTT